MAVDMIENTKKFNQDFITKYLQEINLHNSFIQYHCADNPSTYETNIYIRCSVCNAINQFSLSNTSYLGDYGFYISHIKDNVNLFVKNHSHTTKNKTATLEPYVKYDDYEYEQAFSHSYMNVTGSTYQGQEKLFYKDSYVFQSSIPSGTVTESTVTVTVTATATATATATVKETTREVTITIDKTGRKFRKKKSS